MTKKISIVTAAHPGGFLQIMEKTLLLEIDLADTPDDLRAQSRLTKRQDQPRHVGGRHPCANHERCERNAKGSR